MRAFRRQGLAALVAAVIGSSVLVQAQAPRSAVADAAMAKDAALVRQLLKSGADANGSQGDGMSALHWAALNGDAAMVEMLIVAGANVRATTRIGGFTALHLASQAGKAAVVAPLVQGRAAVDARTATGATALMLAAGAGSAEIVRALADAGADLNLTETANGQSALMFAASGGRTEAAAVLIAKGADLALRSRVVDLTKLEVPEEVLQDQLRQQQSPAVRTEGGAPAPAAAAAAAPSSSSRVAGVSRPYKYNELIGNYGGLTALHFAARQGAAATVRALVEGGADVNALTAGDKTSPMLIAAVNGQFDLVSYLLSKGADPNLASDAGMAPLYAVLNLQWAPKSFYPQPRAQLQQQGSYLEVMTQLLAKGADPNARLQRKISVHAVQLRPLARRRRRRHAVLARGLRERHRGHEAAGGGRGRSGRADGQARVERPVPPGRRDQWRREPRPLRTAARGYRGPGHSAPARRLGRRLR